MTPQQAYELLVQATWLLTLKREEHQSVITALEVLRPKEEKKKPLSETK